MLHPSRQLQQLHSSGVLKQKKIVSLHGDCVFIKVLQACYASVKMSESGVRQLDLPLKGNSVKMLFCSYSHGMFCGWLLDVLTKQSFIAASDCLCPWENTAVRELDPCWRQWHSWLVSRIFISNDKTWSKTALMDFGFLLTGNDYISEKPWMNPRLCL